MNGITALTGLLGLGAGIGFLMTITGIRGTLGRPQRPSRSGTRPIRIHGHRLLGALAAALISAILTHWPAAAILAAAVAWWLPHLLTGGTAYAKTTERIEAIAGWTESLRDTVSAAAGLEQALIATAPAAPAPIAEPVTRLAARLRSGDRLANALYGLADELADPTADLVVTALVTAAEHHARDLAGLLGELAKAARDQAVMRMRVATARARTHSATRIITLTTVVMTALLLVWSRDFLRPYGSVTGQLILLLIGAIFATGFAWLNRQAQFREPSRLLGTPPGGAS